MLLIGMCHTVYGDFIACFIQAIIECNFKCLCYSTLLCLHFLFLLVARKAAGNSLLSAVGYMEHGAVSGGNGHWQIPHSSS